MTREPEHDGISHRGRVPGRPLAGGALQLPRDASGMRGPEAKAHRSRRASQSKLTQHTRNMKTQRARITGKRAGEKVEAPGIEARGIRYFERGAMGRRRPSDGCVAVPACAEE